MFFWNTGPEWDGFSYDALKETFSYIRAVAIVSVSGPGDHHALIVISRNILLGLWAYPFGTPDKATFFGMGLQGVDWSGVEAKR